MLLVSVQADLDLPVSNLLALDQSSTTTGYAIFKDSKPVVISHFTAKGTDLGSRLEQLRNKIIELINEYEIDEVVFEDIQLQDMAGGKDVGLKTFKILAEVFGVVHELVTEKEIKYSTVLPIVWKAHFKIAGKGRAQEKKLTQAHVKKAYNLTCTEDEADSLCIAIYHYDTTNVFDWS